MFDGLSAIACQTVFSWRLLSESYNKNRNFFGSTQALETQMLLKDSLIIILQRNKD